ncbi:MULTISPECIES: polynucleotide kinase-phosphatase [Streptomyces]|uniref:Polynucleotide kinase-phosphatase n=1 Tax=Streptomyces tsukubensis (strain DSM 42081 / NBRC 108919 / NRRL 18488 / 9993) TaxID=1114943 RepID=I2N8E7_STRT9|nr:MULTISPECIES: polynucleotide kinase-phosphatase [Streptomyces]AZK97144.1 polynucleotide kinase-phosphatase [Streptomyces tsukubensis]EIF93294.1 metallophosphoesterase [Streptomyces tsukubensis NRRL18488]MYS68213.1 polynucleotide kinase-phosphatase [Streptomyces sp. SID5473]QKM66887.1 polynucleotide kinase-phosphatase [Streptomyces tsukubensis NRRL18488]TAI44766.1 polynucleotide kinase-phosphatase [Streptomyces tsukubensis]
MTTPHKTGTTGTTGTTGVAAPVETAPGTPAARRLPVTDLSLVVLIGASGSGKSSFARRHFKPTEIISSDFCRGLVADDENDQSASGDAFDVLHYIAGKRLAAGRLTVVDATNVQTESRKQLVRLAREHDVLPIAVVLDLPEEVCAERNALRPDRAGMPRRVIKRHRAELRRSLRGLEREGFRKVHVLRSTTEVDAAEIVIERRFNDLRHLTGPFDIIGDIHGCSSELDTLLAKLGYENGAHPDGRTAVFVGDLVDRGPDSPGVLRRVMSMVGSGNALCVPGNHENKLGRYLKGRNVQHTHGLAETIAQLEQEDRKDPAFREQVRVFIEGLISHYVLDGGALVVCHAGLPEKYHGRTSGRVRSHALYGDTTGETDEFGLPVRYPWAEDYRGRAAVVYGHTPVPNTSWINNTICLDTGVVFGGKMTALRWPERELVDVPAEQVWYEPVKPLLTEAPGAREGRPLDLADVQGRRVVETTHLARIGVREENAAAALEVMSRFAVDPRLLTYLPPTMAPTATSKEDGYLEHPAEAFAQYRDDGVARVVCEEKHMGSRAVALVCRSAATAHDRFGVGTPDGTDGPTGALYTRTGRPFFADEAFTEQIIGRLREAVTAAGLWDELNTDWLLLDAELMPWSLKASGLLRGQYAAVGAAAGAVFPQATAALEAAVARGVDVGGLLAAQRERAVDAAAFTEAYRRYCWTTDGLEGVRFAPFQILAVQGRSLADVPHDEQLALLDRLVAHDPTGLVRTTRRLIVDTGDEESVRAGTDWWLAMTEEGGEGMVVKPLRPLARTPKGALVQPGIKVRGREYLRIIYGPEYTRPVHLEQLRKRFLNHKRSLALREYALGLEALDRLAAGEPLWRIHEAVFAVLALESEPVDPRL